MNKYVYPKFSTIDLGIFRIKGSGLGNLLITYYRAWLIAQNNGFILIEPTWPAIKLGPIIRRERDKRFYFELRKGSIVSNIGRIILYWRMKTTRQLIEVQGLGTFFKELNPFRDDIRYHFFNNVLRHIPRETRDGHTSVHIRLGDFSLPKDNTSILTQRNYRIPSEWYLNEIEKEIMNPNTKRILIFSDGRKDDLLWLPENPKIKLILNGDWKDDLLAMSECDKHIISNSTFSEWGYFLSYSNRYICFGGNMNRNISVK